MSNTLAATEAKVLAAITRYQIAMGKTVLAEDVARSLAAVIAYDLVNGPPQPRKESDRPLQSIRQGSYRDKASDSYQRPRRGYF